MKKEKENQGEICHTTHCGCSANYIWLGIAVIFIVMAAAMIFGN
ncbi:hypothetical protein [Methanobacterium sp.]